MACHCRAPLVRLTAWGPLLLGVIATGGRVATRQPKTGSLVARVEAPRRADLTAPSLSERQAKVLSWWRGLNDPVFAELGGRALHPNLDRRPMFAYVCRRWILKRWPTMWPGSAWAKLARFVGR